MLAPHFPWHINISVCLINARLRLELMKSLDPRSHHGQFSRSEPTQSNSPCARPSQTNRTKNKAPAGQAKKKDIYTQREMEPTCVRCMFWRPNRGRVKSVANPLQPKCLRSRKTLTGPCLIYSCASVLCARRVRAYTLDAAAL